MDGYRGGESPPLERSYRRRGSRSPRRSRYKGGGRRRSLSRHHRSSRRRYRSSSSSGSSRRSRSRRSSVDSSSGGSWGRSRSRCRHKRGSSHKSGAAAALLSSEPFSVKSGTGVLERPTTDWVCKVCSNPNSVKREDCYRCGTPFAIAVNAIPNDEVKISGIPNGTAFGDIQEALIKRFGEHGDTCHIVGYNMVESSRAESKKMMTAYVQFDSVAEATKALTYARSVLFFTENICPMEFSLQRRARKKSFKLAKSDSGIVGVASATTTSTAPVTLVEGLPDHLQPGVWKPVTNFASEEEEKGYLDMLSQHWDKLSQEQKDYYDDGVRRALAAKRRKQQEQQQQVSLATAPTRKEMSSPDCAPSVTDVCVNSSTPSGSLSASESIARRLAEKKQGAKASSVTKATAEHATPAVSLKERLAMKKAQLSSSTKAPSASETEASSLTSASPVVPLTSQKESTVPTPLHLFFGVPIPSRFPTKTDYLTNTKSPFFRAGVIFRYVPPAIAERVVPPSARPPPA